MVALSLNQELRERNMDGFEQDNEGYWHVRKGWRNWGCVVPLSSYMVTLAVMGWFTIVGILSVLPFVVLTIAFGFVVYLMLSIVK